MTKRFEYTDIDGITKEADVYIASEFVTVATASSPVKTLPSGLLDPSLIPAVAQAKAVKVTIDRIATGTILEGDLVRAFSLNHVTAAEPGIDMSSASVLGIALNDAADGEDVEILIFGIITNAMFSVFAVNAVLFLDEAGGITDIKPTLPSRKYLVVIGKSLGGTEVFINIQQPTTLG